MLSHQRNWVLVCPPYRHGKGKQPHQNVGLDLIIKIPDHIFPSKTAHIPRYISSVCPGNVQGCCMPVPKPTALGLEPVSSFALLSLFLSLFPAAAPSEAGDSNAACTGTFLHPPPPTARAWWGTFQLLLWHLDLASGGKNHSIFRRTFYFEVNR